MWRSALVWLLLIVGSLLLAYGIYVEIQVRVEVGSGFYKVMANTFYDDYIAEYRYLSRLGAIIGPLLFVLAYFLRRRSREAFVTSAAACEERASQICATYKVGDAESLPPRARKEHSRLLQKSQRLRSRCD